MASKKAKVENKVGTTFTTEDIIKTITERSKGTDTQLTQKQVADTINLFKDVVSEALVTGQKVQMTGFITIEPSYRSARKGNNVVTGAPMDIPESVVLNVKAGKGLKDVTRTMDASILASLKTAKGGKE